MSQAKQALTIGGMACMMVTAALILAVAIGTVATHAAPPLPVILPMPGGGDHEPAWSEWLAYKYGGTHQHVTTDGSRPDIITETVAWEVEWASHWKEAFGQALLYSDETGLRPGIWLLVRPGDMVNYHKCRRAILRAQVDGLVFEFKVQAVPRKPPKPADTL